MTCPACNSILEESFMFYQRWICYNGRCSTKFLKLMMDDELSTNERIRTKSVVIEYIGKRDAK